MTPMEMVEAVFREAVAGRLRPEVAVLFRELADEKVEHQGLVPKFQVSGGVEGEHLGRNGPARRDPRRPECQRWRGRRERGQAHPSGQVETPPHSPTQCRCTTIPYRPTR